MKIQKSLEKDAELLQFVDNQPSDGGVEFEAEKPQGQSISSMVNQEEAKMLMEMGYSKAVAEKSLFLVQGGGVPKALDWIDQHMDDPDFNEELVVVAQTESKPQSNLTKEEKQAKALELQRQIREKRMIEDAKLARENEEARRLADKELAAAKKLAEEREWENAIKQQKKGEERTGRS